MALTKLEIVALKRMVKSLNPINRKLETLDRNIVKLQEERDAVQKQHDSMIAVILQYTDGIPFMDIIGEEAATTTGSAEIVEEIPILSEENYPTQAIEEKMDGVNFDTIDQMFAVPANEQ